MGMVGFDSPLGAPPYRTPYRFFWVGSTKGEGMGWGGVGGWGGGAYV